MCGIYGYSVHWQGDICSYCTQKITYEWTVRPGASSFCFSMRPIKRGTIKVVPERVNWTVSDWGNLMFIDESRFTVEPVEKRIRIWREQGYHTDLHIFKRRSVTAVPYRDEVLEPIVILYAAAVGPTYVLMDDNARPHRAAIVYDYLESEGIARMAWPAYSPDLNPIENFWDALGRAVSLRSPPPATLIELQTVLQEEW